MMRAWTGPVIAAGLAVLSQVLVAVAAVAALAMMVLVAGNVLTRYVFNTPLPGTVELVQALMVFLVFLPWPAVHLQRSHLQIPILLERLRGRRWMLELFSLLCLLVFLLLTAWQTGVVAWEAMRQKEAFTGALTVPTGPSRLAITAGVVLFAVVGLVDLVRLVTGDRGHPPSDPDSAHG